MIPIQLTKAVVENGSDVGPFSPLPIHLCALCDLCGIPPHPDPETFSDGLELEVVRKGQWQSKIGLAIGIGIEWTREGIRPFRTGYRNRIIAVLTQLGSEV